MQTFYVDVRVTLSVTSTPECEALCILWEAGQDWLPWPSAGGWDPPSCCGLLVFFHPVCHEGGHKEGQPGAWLPCFQLPVLLASF